MIRQFIYVQSKSTASETQMHYLKYFFSAICLVMALLSVSSFSNAAIDVYEFDTPQQEAQYKALIDEFRCPKCQNQNLAGSDSQIAQDLKRKTYEMVMAGQTDAQIREYMYERYGDFISYKPPVRPSTWILWYFPPLILLLLIIWWFWKNRGKQEVQTEKVATATGSSATVSGPNDNAIDDVGTNLSAEDAEKLKQLLNKYDNDADSNKNSE